MSVLPSNRNATIHVPYQFAFYYEKEPFPVLLPTLFTHAAYADTGKLGVEFQFVEHKTTALSLVLVVDR